jgi:hypothetical protein
VTAPTTREWLRAAVDRVSVGSQRLATRSIGRVVRGVSSRFGRWSWWVQLPLAYVALLRGPVVLARIGDRVHERVASGAWTGVLTVTTVLWIVAAYRVGRNEEASPTVDVEPGEVDEEQPEPALGQSPVGRPAVTPVALVAAVRDIGTPHAQLKPLAQHLLTTTDAVRAAAAELGWPVKDVRQDGRSSSAGLRWDECPSPESIYPLSDDVGAGQPADDNDDDSGKEGVRKGVRVKPIGLAGKSLFGPDTEERANLPGEQ